MMYVHARLLPLLLVLLAFNGVRAQGPTPPDFGQYVREQHKLFTALYEKRDAAGYTRLMDGWLQRYAQLPDSLQKQFKPSLINVYYRLSCTYAQLRQKGPALDYLQRSIQAGNNNYSYMQQDSALNGLRQDPQFIALMEPLRATGDFMYILRRGGAYNAKDQRALPAFTYQSAADSNLTALRTGFNLDSVAGKGSEVSKVLNLLHWVHELIPHDGNHENPPVRNALAMIGVCKSEKRGLNCRGLSTVLNECYLAMGFKSRLVTCLPKDSLGTDFDCHVINVVYIPSLKKWIWTDPTQDAYVMNEKGDLLDIREVRERLINGQPLILNPTANWNHQVSAVKEQYLYQYMAKNLYRLQCPVNSKYNMELGEPGKTIQYIQLLPLDYFKQDPAVRTSTTKSGTKYEYYNTNNPDAFWQLPL
ncbi:transglutaminase-like domain-containing protein [Paraflavitalea pollutisoli]|uniref:transglutaminase-like domain-containing protein n=1 Tax=Paraflavitalea pollutisoli TaxID=3034143 RepID=UPI0023EBC5A5|nr:transglutaminase-like domain-containing protein [Paraflavitalea sp. H1-2-19X]